MYSASRLCISNPILENSFAFFFFSLSVVPGAHAHVAVRYANQLT